MMMRTFSATLVSGILLICLSCNSSVNKSETEKNNSDKAVTFVEKPAENKVDVMVGGKLFTSYYWPTDVYKPILYPVNTAAGTTITRGFPIQPRAGERSDHRHQVGIWLNYGNVNGYDFWGNGAEGERQVKLGTVKHSGIESMSGGDGEGTLVTRASWVDSSGTELLSESSTYQFIADGTTRIIDRTTVLTATGDKVDFPDTKEGSLGIRVARQLELPSDEEITLLDAQGVPTKIKAMSNEGVTGNYRSSEGLTGADVWGKRAKWMDLYGSIGDEKISLVICDHPGNLNYPTYWHARGYGLFAANPFGVKDFTGGKDSLNYSIPAGQSLTLKYRFIISSGEQLTDEVINGYANAFAKNRWRRNPYKPVRCQPCPVSAGLPLVPCMHQNNVKYFRHYFYLE